MTLTTMHVTQSIEIAAPREKVWDAFIGHPTSWWGHPYLALDYGNTRIEIPDGLGKTVTEHAGAHKLAWGTVSEIDPALSYAWTGTMAMNTKPSWGEVSFRFEDVDPRTGSIFETARADADTTPSTRVTVTHDHLGTISKDTIRTYDYGWADLIARLKTFVEDNVWLGSTGQNREAEFEFTPSVEF
jgi:uncharacterized protein YndB with AHSA1/START domain